MTVAPSFDRDVSPSASESFGSRLAAMKDATRRGVPPTRVQRIAALDRLADALTAQKDAVIDAISSDFGNRARQETLLCDVFAVLSAIEYTKEHLRDWMEPRDRELSLLFKPATAQVMPQPLGVVGIISPWNYPFQLALIPLVAALAAGNRALIKPSELVPRTAALLADMVSEVFPRDQVGVITGGAEVGVEFAGLPFDHIVFTGSTRVGKLVMKAASANLVPVTLELGGKSPAIVGSDFPIRVAATRIMAGKAFNGGQTCVAPDYALIPRTARDAFVQECRTAAAKLYPSIAANRDYTSIVNEGHYARLRAIIDDAKARGATIIELVSPGESADALSFARKIPVTLIVDPTSDMLCMKDEIFGPLLPIVPYDRLDDAIGFVNDRDRPLALYYFGHKKRDVDRILAETVAGGVTLNETMLHAMQDDLPFGGVGASGMGQYHGQDGFDALSKRKPVFRQSRISTTALVRPPYGAIANRLLRFLIGP